ncbi:hypothetical protein [Pseudoclavibacter soli]|uniref:hypothetical protein n=1 Tax=Pseudoclavibacter soli TaxID=452623 RepID=UPI000489950B|nr:hypothetical protein [Pseudoclavibacter soli]
MFHNYDIPDRVQSARTPGGFRTVDLNRDAEVIFWTSLQRDIDEPDETVSELRWGDWRIPFDLLEEDHIDQDPDTGHFAYVLRFARFGTTRDHPALEIDGRRASPPLKEVPDAVFTSPGQERQARLLAIEGTLMRRSSLLGLSQPQNRIPFVFIEEDGTRHMLTDFGTPTEADYHEGRGQEI